MTCTVKWLRPKNYMVTCTYPTWTEPSPQESGSSARQHHFFRGVRCGILVLNPLITQEFLQGVVLELRAIVTSYCQDSHVIFPLGLLVKVNEGGLRLVLGLEE